MAVPAEAQPYPVAQSTTVNDYAELLPPEREAVLSARLMRLQRETGVEMTVLTLDSRAAYSGASLERFAQGLFDAWGIGDAARNDGVLVLILREDRAMRIELGAAYGRSWDGVAEAVIDDHFLPAFRAENYAGGIVSGSNALIEELVMPFLGGAEPHGTDAPGLVDFGFFTLVGLIILAVANTQLIADLLVRFRTCPTCGGKGLRQTRRVLADATHATEGHGVRERHCRLCGHRESHPYLIARIPRNDRRGGAGGFGGGRSGGGGASGRW